MSVVSDGGTSALSTCLHFLARADMPVGPCPPDNVRSGRCQTTKAAHELEDVRTSDTH